MSSFLKPSACVILSVIVIVSSSVIISGYRPVKTESALAIGLATSGSDIVVETDGLGSFQEALGYAYAKGVPVTFASSETGILTLGHEGMSAQVIDKIQNMAGVVSVSTEKKARAFFIPNDPNRNLQWGLDTINAYEAWDITRGNHSVVVGVLDTGIDWTHPDLAANIWTDIDGYHGYNFIDDNRQPMDDNINSYDEYGIWQPNSYTYHGTHVAGVVGAVIDNSIGVAGMAQAQLMAVKVMNDSGEGTDATVASGIRWAVDHGADIVTMSLGVEGMSTTLNNAINYASTHGVVLIAASGNSGSSVVSYPAANPKVIAVGAIDNTERPAPFSNYGSNLDIMAPGSSIYSTMVGGSYQYLSGTSTATPYVAGVVALLLTVNPALTPEQVGITLNTTAIDIRTTGYDEYSGWGIVNAFQAVEEVSGPAVTITSHPVYAAINSTFSITWMVTGGNPGVIQSTHLSWGETPTALTQSSSSFSGQTWATFTVDNIPSLLTNGTIYIKAYATVDGSAYESELLELPVHEPTGGDLFTQFLRDVRKFIVEDLGLLNFLIILGLLIAVPLIIVAARPKRRRAVAHVGPTLQEYQPVNPAHYLPPPPPPPPRFETYVDLMGGEIMPSSVTVFEGTKVVWVNRTWAPPPGVMIRSGTVDQSGEHPDGTFQSGMLIAPGDYWSATFHRPGVYPYYITGVWKTGRVVVESVKSRTDAS